MEHRSEITSFCFRSEFFANEGSQNVFFWFPKLGNFLKHPGTSENVPELPRTPGELPKNTRELSKNTWNFPKTPGTSPNVPGTSRNTSGTFEHPGNFPKTPG
jgi:hypothetical protein